MEQTTIAAFAPLAPLAIGLICAYIASHVRNARTVTHIGLSDAEFELAFDQYVERRFQEGNR
jgi:hypothetical protein